MKLRMRGNTLRLRLTRSEVASIEAGSSVIEQTEFPDGSVLRYELLPGSTASAGLVMEGRAQIMRIEVPARQAMQWATGDDVGLAGEHPLQMGPLAVLVEKDFTCVTPREGEEELDTYPNPNVA